MRNGRLLDELSKAEATTTYNPTPFQVMSWARKIAVSKEIYL
jgi:hypothetical protein